MFRAKTVFVIGAGASYEVGLPIGDSLLKTIVELTHFGFQGSRQSLGDLSIVEALKLILDEKGGVELLNQHLNAGRQLGRSAQQAISIDNVIDALENDQIERLGKLGIARAILAAEAASDYFKLNDSRELTLSKFANTWYSSLTKLITEERRVSGIADLFENVEIINFNYDRCLEHYLQFSLSNYYGVPIADIQAAMSKLTIHRPYGMVGRLPWRDGDGPPVDFGAGGPKQLVVVAEEIRTFTEQIREGDQVQAMRDALAQADRVVFLGFAFHRQNIRLIATEVQDHTTFLATAHGIEPSDQSVIERELAEAFGFGDFFEDGQRIELVSTTCNDLFRGYRLTLTAAPPAI